MGIFFGPEKRSSNSGQTFAEPIIPPYLGANVYGNGGPSVASRPDSALAVPTVWACVGLLSNSVSMLPLETYRRSSGGIPSRVKDPMVVTSPASTFTQSEWLHMLMVSLLLRGNAYGLIVTRDQSTARPEQIEILNPDKVRVSIGDSGRVEYRIGDDDRNRADDMWHVRGMTLPGAKVGLSPVAYAAATLGVDIYSRQFASGFFSDGAHPSSILSTDQAVTQEDARTVKDRFLAAVRGREPAVLGAGIKYTQIQVTPEESQFLATQQANVAQVARYFWIPPEMVGGSGGNSMTYANVEQRSLDFLTYAVSFWLKRIEDAFFPLLPEPQYVRFNTSALLRTDAETQAKVDIQLLAGKVKTPTEVRAERDMPPMTDDQKAEADLVPLTVTPLGSAKALPALKQNPGEPAAIPVGDQQGAVNG